MKIKIIKLNFSPCPGSGREVLNWLVGHIVDDIILESKKSVRSRGWHEIIFSGSLSVIKTVI